VYTYSWIVKHNEQLVATTMPWKLVFYIKNMRVNEGKKSITRYLPCIPPIWHQLILQVKDVVFFL